MLVKRKGILFLTLHSFSLTGGIEKMSRSVAKALYQVEREGLCTARTYSIYDQMNDLDRRYLPSTHFRGFAGNRLKFIFYTLLQGMKCEKIILGHIHLLPAAFLIKLLRPSARIVVFAHGIEFWRPIRSWERKFLRTRCQQIWAVSRYTAEQVRLRHGIHPSSIRVLNNCIDPFFDPPRVFEKPEQLYRRFSIQPDQPLLLTLTRLSSTEAYKGYNLVIECMDELIASYPSIKYVIAGKADDVERKRLEAMISAKGLEQHVLLAGFVPESELSAMFRLADIFVMPSKKEGFGIVFIEAAACGCRIIAGNHDGSPDALLGGRLGRLINPDDKKEMVASIRAMLDHPKSNRYSVFTQSLCLSTFGFENYVEQLKQLLTSE